ncbi:MAG: purine-nucleoside phosphorylase [Desulfovibrionales bacterium GWA2_65_9]|nr:MAG: purine-nucleoside phosphorylase [Desulfovibrionales bacterium GWA2_65_9]
MSIFCEPGEFVLVSACLASRACRYDGDATPHPEIMRLAGLNRVVPVCPEVLGGLSVPREPVELLGGRAVTRSGADCTEAFQVGAQLALALALDKGCCRAVLKSRSPSCGSGRVYDGTFSGRLVPGDGVLAALLKAKGIEVLSEEDI